ncbi:Protein of uncharacterised function (DUF1471) [Tatumella ptyseos]|uniref:Protein of uncharacterized function (DUF1471) n=1 Tax=Tatumella ptyseos TaxID=82987 RepID=A0A2X5SHR7_9GAMM|nr:Protein of uncharacterised function (DUF1471) [Tatumella ptyseos]
MDAISRAAKEKGAASFFIVRQIDANNGGNQYVTAYIYKADAKTRQVQSPDAIPANSEAGKAALAAGGSAAKNVQIPGVASSDTRTEVSAVSLKLSHPPDNVTLSPCRMAGPFRISAR